MSAVKRTIDEVDAAAASNDMKKSKVEADGEVLDLRFLIDNREVGSIIGKGGANVQRVRTECSVFISVLKSNAEKVAERIMTIKGSPANVAYACDVVSSILVEASQQRHAKAAAAAAAAGQEQPPAPEPRGSLRLLVHRTLAGAIIGKGGEIIRAIQADTGARVQLSNEPLVGSSEKTVTISGTPAVMRQGFIRVLARIAENPLKPGTQLVPYMPGAPMYAPPPHMGYGAPPMHHYGAPPQHHYGAPPPRQYGAPPAHHQQPPQQQQQHQQYGGAPHSSTQQKIAIPTVCAGSVIGKGGSVVRDIKAQSGCHISLADPLPESPNERVVTITGTAQGIQTAIYLITQRVEQFPPQSQY